MGRCETCKFSDLIDGEWYPHQEEEPDKVRICRRYPPSQKNPTLGTLYVRVSDTDWCGEHKDKYAGY